MAIPQWSYIYTQDTHGIITSSMCTACIKESTCNLNPAMSASVDIRAGELPNFFGDPSELTQSKTRFDVLSETRWCPSKGGHQS